MRYFYKGIDQSGAPESGSIEAGSEQDAFMTLQSRGLTLFELGDRPETGSDVAWWRRDIQLFPTRLSLGDQASVAETMAVLFKLHLPLNETLRMLEGAIDNAIVRRHFIRTGQRVADGEPLADAFVAAGSAFSPLFHVLLQVSDAANTLPETMAELSRYLRNQERIRAKLSGALVYPLILILAAVVLVLVIVFYLAPALEPMFTSVNKAPPASLAFFLSVNRALSDYGFLIMPIALAVGTGLVVFVRGPQGEGVRRAVVSRLPLWGAIARQAALVRQIRALTMLLKSGMPLADALESVQRFMGSDGPDWQGAAERLKQGGRSADVLGADPALPPIARDLFRMGEETNRLPEVLAALSQTLEDRLNAQTQKATTLITPAITLVLGLGIGLLIYQVMGAILDINELAF